MTAVAWVAGTGQTQSSAALSVTAAAPAGLANGDQLFAAVYGVDCTFTTPTGWTKIAETSALANSSARTQYLAVFSKDSVAATDSGASFTFERSAAVLTMGVAFAATRFGDVAEITAAVHSLNNQVQNDYTITPPQVTATGDGQMALVFASTFNTGTTTTASVSAAGYTLFTGTPVTGGRVVGGYALLDSGEQTTWVEINLDTSSETGSGTNGLNSISLLLPQSSEAPPSTTAEVQPYSVSTAFGGARVLLDYFASGATDSVFGVPRSGGQWPASALEPVALFGTAAYEPDASCDADTIAPTTVVGFPSSIRGPVPVPGYYAQPLFSSLLFGSASVLSATACGATGFLVGAWGAASAVTHVDASSLGELATFGAPTVSMSRAAASWRATAFGQARTGMSAYPAGFVTGQFGAPSRTAVLAGSAEGLYSTQFGEHYSRGATATRSGVFRVAFGRAQVERTQP